MTEDGNIQILRASLEEVRGKFGDPGRGRLGQADPGQPGGSAADRRTALKVVAGQADTATFDALLAQAKAEKDPLAKQHLFEASGGSARPNFGPAYGGDRLWWRSSGRVRTLPPAIPGI